MIQQGLFPVRSNVLYLFYPVKRIFAPELPLSAILMGGIFPNCPLKRRVG